MLVELPEADLSGRRDRYAVATDLFTRWQAEGILVADPVPSLYPYRMTDTVGRATTGVIGALGLAEPGDGERHPAPRADAPQAQERPARPPAGHAGEPVPHLGPLHGVRA